MKKFCIIISFLVMVANLAAQTYGAGVEHRLDAPTSTPQYSKKPSLLSYDSTEQALYVNSKRFGWYKLISPWERYVRAVANLNFNNGQLYTWASVEGFITISAGGSQMVKNGYYLVKFTANQSPLDSATVDFTGATVAVASALTTVTNNDMFLVRYYRGVLISLNFIDDKTNRPLATTRDTLIQHRIEIDSLKADSSGTRLDSFLNKNYLYVPLTVFACYQEVLAPPSIAVNILDSLNNYFVVPPTMVGDTLIGVQIGFCQSSNWIAQIRIARAIENYTVQWFTPQAIRVPENQLFFYANITHSSRVLVENDRIIVYSLGYFPPQNAPTRIPAKGLSATLVIKPKRR